MNERQKEDRERVLRLLIEHREAIFSFIGCLVGDLSVAEDIMQDVAVVVCDKWDQFETGTDFGKWARQIARYRVLSDYRKRKNSVRLLSSEAMESVAEVFDEQAGPAPSDRLRALRKCLKGLKGRARRVVEMRYEEGVDCSGIAREIGSSVTNVYMMLTRARMALAGCVDSKLSADGGHRP